VSKFVFRKDDEQIKFVGDFESLYQSDDDPWQQSSEEPTDMQEYYEFSRQNLINLINTKKLNNILEVGCGLGYTTNLIHERTGCEIDGLDISNTAIQKSSSEYKHLSFFNGNIFDYEFTKKYSTIIISQCLWYILHEFDDTITNITSQLPKNGHILFSQAFLKEQKYGVDVINGHQGLVDYFKNHDDYELTYYEYNQNGLVHNDGTVLVRKR